MDVFFSARAGSRAEAPVLLRPDEFRAGAGFRNAFPEIRNAAAGERVIAEAMAFRAPDPPAPGNPEVDQRIGTWDPIALDMRRTGRSLRTAPGRPAFTQGGNDRIRIRKDGLASSGAGVDTGFLSGMGKAGRKVVMLLDADKVLSSEERVLAAQGKAAEAEGA